MKHLLRIVWLTLSLAGLAQIGLSQTDTLPQEIAVKGSSKAADLVVQGKSLLKTNPDRCLDIGLQALVTAKKEGDSFTESMALELLAEANYALASTKPAPLL